MATRGLKPGRRNMDFTLPLSACMQIPYISDTERSLEADFRMTPGQRSNPDDVVAPCTTFACASGRGLDPFRFKSFRIILDGNVS